MQDKKKQVGFVLVILLTVAAVIYVAFAAYFQKHFSFGTTIDGISVGGYGVEKVENLICREIGNYTLKLSLREDASEEIVGKDISLAPVFSGEIEQLLEEQNGFAWLSTWIQKKNYELDRMVSYDEKQLEQAVKQLSCMKTENQREPVDASVSDYSKEEGYQLVPADYGTTIDEAALMKTVKESVSVLEEEIILDEMNCYQNPKILDDNANLLSNIEKMNQYVNTVIQYDFDEKSECLDGNIIHTWLSVENEKVIVNREVVEEYVKGLGKKYNTAYQPKELKTSYGNTVTITNGFYGWRIDKDAEIEQILADLETGGTIKREPVYAQRANSHGENDYGDSYVEINLTAQHLFVYKDGALVVQSDFVSGNVSKGNGTPTGAFGLTYKTLDAVLRGPDYETPVKYWMPFAGDVGMHDATWRRQFGGNIYKTGGSHGCINLPLSVAETIYKTVDKGYAVLVYELPGTESKAVLQKDASNIVNMINSIGAVTLESETVIVSARNLYNALPENAKGYVTNYEVLVAAEASLAALKNGTAPEVGAPEEGMQPEAGISQPEAGEAQQVEQPQPEADTNQSVTE